MVEGVRKMYMHRMCMLCLHDDPDMRKKYTLKWRLGQKMKLLKLILNQQMSFNLSESEYGIVIYTSWILGMHVLSIIY